MEPDEQAVVLVEEVCTRPEPVILRASQRPAPPAAETVSLSAEPIEVAAEPIEVAAELIEIEELPIELCDEAFEPVQCLPVVLTPSPVSVMPAYALTPALGTLVGELPVLPSEALDELAAEDHVQRIATRASVGMTVSAACADAESELSPLNPGVSIVPSRQSDVRDLVASFSVAGDDPGVELCRAVKEMAGLELTPAPFAALIR